MRICKSCGASFPTRIFIEGKERNLQRRKFCFTCSPFGKHNTSKYLGTKRVCPKHGECDFIYHEDRSPKCKKCRTEEVLTYRRGRNENLVGLFGGKCEICNYKKCVRALQFHHVEKEEKTSEKLADSKAAR